MKGKGWIAFLSAFVVTLIVLGLFFLIFLADLNTRSVGGAKGEYAVLAFSPTGPASADITLLGQRYNLNLQIPLVTNFLGGVARFYETLTPGIVRGVSAAVTTLAPYVWKDYLNLASWFSRQFFGG